MHSSLEQAHATWLSPAIVNVLYDAWHLQMLQRCQQGGSTGTLTRLLVPAGLYDVGQLFWHVSEAIRLKTCRLSSMRHEGCQLISARCQLLCLPAVALAECVSVAKVQQSKVLQPAPADGVWPMQRGVACKRSRGQAA